MHMADDILNFGTPMEFDTGSNESAHKTEKKAAKLTQRRRETFDLQTAKRLQELHILDMAMLEIEGKCLWNYGCHMPTNIAQSAKKRMNALRGDSYYTNFDDNLQKNVAILNTRKRGNQSLTLPQNRRDLAPKSGIDCRVLWCSKSPHCSANCHRTWCNVNLLRAHSFFFWQIEQHL